MEPANPVDSIPLGLSESFSKTVTEGDVYLFAGITGDLYGIHVDEQFAASTRFGRRIAHGALLVGFVSAAMSRINGHLPPPGGVSTHYEVDLVAPVFFGDTITTTLTVQAKVPERREIQLAARCTNHRGETVLEGRTILRVPRRMTRPADGAGR